MNAVHFPLRSLFILGPLFLFDSSSPPLLLSCLSCFLACFFCEALAFAVKGRVYHFVGPVLILQIRTSSWGMAVLQVGKLGPRK